MKDFYDRNGYFSPLKIYNAEEANSFRSKLENSEKKIGKLHYIVKTYTIMKWVYEIATNKILLDFVEEIIGKNILLYNATFIIKEPNTKTHVSWHQDLTYWGFDDNEKQVSAWLALSKADEVSGCMQMIPGSHKNGFFEHHSTEDKNNVLLRGQTVSGIDLSNSKSCPLAPGEASFHHGLTLHSSKPNNSNDRRIGLNFQYITPDMKQLKNKNDSAICVRGEDKFNNFKIDKIAKTDFDYTAYGNLLDLNKQYIQTQNKKQILN